MYRSESPIRGPGNLAGIRRSLWAVEIPDPGKARPQDGGILNVMGRPQPIQQALPQTEFSRGQGQPIQPDDSDRAQIVERLAWTPKQRFQYLVEMIAFEERAHRVRRRD